MEIPLIFLTIALIKLLLEKRTLLKIITIATLFIILTQRSFYVINQTRSEYNGLFTYFKKATNNFTQYERMYVLGSIRSLKWYRQYVPDLNILLYRRDYKIMCPEFKDFKYIAFDKDELLKDPQNLLYSFVKTNQNSFEYKEIAGMHLYERTPNSEVTFSCPIIEH